MGCDTIIALNLSLVETQLPEPEVVALCPGTVAGYKLAFCSVESFSSFLSLNWFGVFLQ